MGDDAQRMTPNAPADVKIFIADDNDTRGIWETRFAEVPDPAGERTLQILREVAPSAQEARAYLRSVINADQLPAVVVIDHRLAAFDRKDPGGDESGLGLMRWLADACAARGARLPHCVLWTADLDQEPGLAPAFREAGGTHVYPRTLPSPEFVAALWRIVDGDEPPWQHHYVGPELALTPTLVPMLPYFEAELATSEIARRLRANGRIGPEIVDPEKWVNDKRGKIQKACNAHAERLTGERPFIHGQGAALARYAREHGYNWVPLKYQREAA